MSNKKTRKNQQSPQTPQTPQTPQLSFLREHHSLAPSNPTISPNLHGWFQPSNQVLIHKYIKQIKPKIILELGTWLGKSAIFMCKHSPKNTAIICVDMWQGDKSIGYTTEHNGINLYEQFLTNMAPLKKQIFPVKMDGRRAIKYLFENGIKPDMIYLDMGHTYEDVRGDLATILKYFNGIPIIGDDYNYYDSTRQAVIEARVKYNIPYMDVDGNCYAFLWTPPKFHTKTPVFTIDGDRDSNSNRKNAYKYRERITHYGQPILYKNASSAPPVLHICNHWKDLAKGGGVIVYIPAKYNGVKYPPITHTPLGIVSICNPEYSVDLMADLGILVMGATIARKLFRYIEDIEQKSGNFGGVNAYNVELIVRYHINYAIMMEQIPIQYVYLSRKLRPLDWGRNKYKTWVKRYEKIIYHE
jgi:hypothetical protein